MDIEIKNLEHYVAAAAHEVLSASYSQHTVAALDDKVEELKERKAKRAGLLYEMRRVSAGLRGHVG